MRHVAFWVLGKAMTSRMLDRRKQHDQTVKTKGKAAVGRRAKIRGLNKKAKLLLSLLGREAKGFKHAALHFARVDANGAAAHFITVEHHVVGTGAGFAGSVTISSM